MFLPKLDDAKIVETDRQINRIAQFFFTAYCWSAIFVIFCEIACKGLSFRRGHSLFPKFNGIFMVEDWVLDIVFALVETAYIWQEAALQLQWHELGENKRVFNQYLGLVVTRLHHKPAGLVIAKQEQFLCSRQVNVVALQDIRIIIVLG